MSRRVLVILSALLMIGIGAVSAQDSAPVSIIFMHHSTGLGIIQQGNVREGFANLGYVFWDHGYNEEGLTDPAGNSLGINWDVPGDNTDPDGWYEIFQQPYTDPPSNTLSHMLQYDVIIFKSCFPTSDITDDDMFAAYQRYYRSIREVMDQYPDKLFVAWTTPPLVPNSTTPENAARARKWAEYLTSDEYLEGHPNVFVFDIFNLLADDDGFLRAEYRVDEWDSHPNEPANQAVGPILVDFADQAVRSFVPGEPGVQPVTVNPEDAATTPAVLGVAGEVIEDFERDPAQLADYWWSWGDEGVELDTFELAAPGFDSEQALKVTFRSPTEHYGGFGMSLDPVWDWSAVDGISFFWQADQPDLIMGVYVGVADPENPDAPVTPFLVYLTPPAGDWEQVMLSWGAFTKAEWIGDEGVDVFDPANISEVSFVFGNWEKAQQATLWLDDIRLALAESS
ncbi:MAG: hypothetical protein IPK52_27420 [Chloroflexi bacterium]|nr:hypothetical protein [Chloroflexota bacterium]